MTTTVATLSIRDRIRNIQGQVLGGAFTPSLAREHLMQLTGLFGAVLDEMRQADYAYTLVLLRLIDSGEAVNRATIRAALTPEYARLREAKDIEKLVLEMLRGCKVYLKSLDEEMALAR